MACKISGVEMRVFTKSDFNGTGTSIHLLVPIDIDFEDKKFRHDFQVYWRKNGCLPPDYADANDFIAEVTKICKIDQIMLGCDFYRGNYVDFVIIKEGSASKIVKKLGFLIKSTKKGDK